MRLTAILFIAGMLQVRASGYSQTVTLSEKEVPLQVIFAKIKKQTGYTFFYNESLLEQAGKVSVRASREPLKTVLDNCFRDLPLLYAIVGKTVVIKPKEAQEQVQEMLYLTPPRIIFEGRLINGKGEPLANATILNKRNNRTYTTRVDGRFTLNDVQLGDILSISFIGYKTREYTIGTEATATIVLQESVSKLDEVIIQGYGTTDRRTLTGNIVKVTSEEIERQPVMNPLLALSGRVAGLVVTPTSGYASGAVKVELRGRKTISSSFVSDPLYIVDGVPLTILNVGQTGSYDSGTPGFIQNGTVGPAMGQSPLFSLNPADIESIEVLKDADATAIYGSRGANGVILITTKKGSSGNTRFNINASQGISRVTNHWDMMNTQQYVAMRREAFKNDGIPITDGNAPDLTIWDTTRYTDWQKELWGNYGHQTTIGAGMSGGDARTQFRISSNYQRQTEILTYSGANQRASFSVNLGHNSMNRKFKADLTANYSYTAVNTIGISSVTTLPPNAPPIYNSDGELNFDEWNKAGLQYSYPFASLRSPYTSNTNFITANMVLRYELLKGLELSGSFGYNNSNNANRSQTPVAAQNPALNPTGSAFAGNTVNNNWIIEPQLNYKTALGKGRLTVLLGGSMQTNKTKANGINGWGYTGDDLLNSLVFAPNKTVVDNYGEYKYAALFGRINYTWDNKYILNLNGRRDGSSRFGPGKQFGNFGSTGIAWIASEESFVKSFLPAFISFVKLRGSYGITGSDAVGDYKYLSQWSARSTVGSDLYSYGGITPLVSQLAVNPEYHWQVNKKLEAALNLGFLNDRINLELAYYRDRCDDQLTQYPIPVYTGFSSVTANWPALVQNSGWELMMTARLIDQKKFSWSVSFNGAINDNVLVKYPGIQYSPYATQYKEGESLNVLYLLHYTGVNPLTGIYSFADDNHDGQITATTMSQAGAGFTDRYVAKDLSPQFTGGFGTDLSYAGFQLSCFFTFKKQEAMNGFYNITSPGAMSNVPASLTGNHWQKPGDDARFARYSTQAPLYMSYFMLSDGIYTDASFLRLSNLAMSYQLPEKLVKKAGLTQCNVFMHAQNVFVITNYEGVDPETPAFGTLPPAKMFTCGINFNF